MDSRLDALPAEVLSACLSLLGAPELCALASCAARFRGVAQNPNRFLQQAQANALASQ